MRNHPTFTLVLPVLLVTTLAACTLSDGGAQPRPGARSSAATVRPTAAEAKKGDDAALAHGKSLFQHSWTKRDPLSRGGDGLGPNFNGSSCTGCHNQGGIGGAGGSHGNTFIFGGVMIPKQTDDSDRGAFGGKTENKRR